MCSTWPFFKPFQNTSFAAVFLRVQTQSGTGPPASAKESQVLFTHLNEIHSDVTFQRITSAWGSREEVSSLVCHWLKKYHSPPLVTDGTNDPELLSVMVKRPNPPFPPTPSRALHLSQFCLAVSQPVGFAIPFSFYCTTLSASLDTSPKWSSSSFQSQVR